MKKILHIFIILLSFPSHGFVGINCQRPKAICSYFTYNSNKETEIEIDLRLQDGLNPNCKPTKNSIIRAASICLERGGPSAHLVEVRKGQYSGWLPDIWHAWFNKNIKEIHRRIQAEGTNFLEDQNKELELNKELEDPDSFNPDNPNFDNFESN